MHAVDGVSFSVKRGETFGLVGESGCGKTTTARAILSLDAPTSGEIFFDGQEVSRVFKSKDKAAILKLRRKMQYVFQNPYASLDPRMTVADIIMEPLLIHEHVPKDKWHDQTLRVAKIGRSRRISRGTVSARVQRRTETENLHCESFGCRTRITDCRRTCCISGRFCESPNPKPSAGTAAKIQNNLLVHQSRFEHCQAYLSPHSCHVLRKIC